MKTLKYLLVGVAAIPALAAPAFAQSAKPATPPPAAADDAAQAAFRSMVGEIVAADQAARTVTVMHLVASKPVHVVFNVDEATLPALAQLKPGDHVKVTYVQRGETRIIKTIVKA
ncbi:MAG TPA: hypothetical protein VEL75_10520 [Candidatus Methylomirabilis sp.]|nr:hypothetical protein [Candidatus Methylomirabilis sp.]